MGTKTILTVAVPVITSLPINIYLIYPKYSDVLSCHRIQNLKSPFDTSKNYRISESVNPDKVKQYAAD